MKHLQRTEQATSKQGLKKIVRRVWNAITPEYLEKLYESLPRRMAAVIASKGAHTKYWCICNRFVLVKTSINELTFQVGTFFLEDSNSTPYGVGVVLVPYFKNGITFERLEISTWFFVCAYIMSIRFSARNFFEIGWAQPAQPAYQPKFYKMG